MTDYTQTQMLGMTYSDIKTTADAMAKALFKNKELVAPIMQMVVPEFRDMAVKDIINCIEPVSVTENNVLNDFNPQIEGLNTEYKNISEKLIYMDSLFKAKNPKTDNGTCIYLFFNFEMQNDYSPGYPIPTRGLYYCARHISSQLGTLTKDSEYNKLNKIYSIWICNDRIPKDERNTVSSYRIHKEDTYSTARDNPNEYDLFEVILIRRGDNEDSDVMLFDYLNNLFEGDLVGVREYTDIEIGSELEKEVDVMKTFDETRIERAYERGVNARDKKAYESVINMIKGGFLTIDAAVNVGEYDKDVIMKMLAPKEYLL